MTKADTLRLVGLDPSLRNWGISTGIYDTATRQLKLESLQVICADEPKGKQVRKNSKDLEIARQLCAASIAAAKDANAIFVEVPTGSQSARAMASYGICVGVLGALRATGIPFFEVTANEVKLAGPGIKNASKEQMIEWAIAKHGEIAWPSYIEHGKVLISMTKAEHVADATAAIYAGIAGNTFQQMLAMR